MHQLQKQKMLWNFHHPPPHATRKTSDASEMAGNLKLIIHSPKTNKE
jgi:hypothetical protein